MNALDRAAMALNGLLAVAAILLSACAIVKGIKFVYVRVEFCKAPRKIVALQMMSIRTKGGDTQMDQPFQLADNSMVKWPLTGLDQDGRTVALPSSLKLTAGTTDETAAVAVITPDGQLQMTSAGAPGAAGQCNVQGDPGDGSPPLSLSFAFVIVSSALKSIGLGAPVVSVKPADAG